MASRLPEEILVEIFRITLHARPHIDRNPLHPIPMERTLLRLFRDFYSLQSVCRAWRGIILSTLSRGLFWYFSSIYCTNIPVLRYTSAPKQIPEISGGDLYLASVMGGKIPPLLRGFPASRFCKVNLVGESHSPITAFIERLLETGPPYTLSELSLYEQTQTSEEDMIPVLSNTSTLWDSFCQLLKSLSAFRVRGAHFDWDSMLFSSRLIEVQLQDVYMGSDRGEFVGFLRVLGSAPYLRDLKMISIISTFDAQSLGIVSPQSVINFPSLESLFLEDIAHHTLATILDYVVSESHRLILHLTEQGAILDTTHPTGIRLESLRAQLETVDVDTLILAGDWGDWALCSELYDLLCWVPELTSLKLNNWKLGEDECHTISRTLANGEVEDGEFPMLEYLDLSCVQILDEECLKEMVASHPIQTMVLGGYIISGTEESPRLESLQANTPIVNWLRDNVPDFTLTCEYAQPPEYSSSVWQLW